MPEPAWLNGSNSNPSDASPSDAAPAGDNAPAGDKPALTLDAPNGSTPLSAQLDGDTTTPSKDAPTADGQQPKDASKAESKEGDKPADGSPYEAFTLPEGMSITDAHQAALTEYGQKYNIPQEGVQQVVDLGVEIAQMTREAIEQESEQGIAAMHAEWRKQLHADPDLGGANFKKTQANLDAFQQSALATPALLQFLSESNLVMHPEITRLLNAVGASLKEQPVAFGGDTPKPERNPAKEIYSKSGHV